MFYQSLLVENVVYELSLNKNGSVALLSETSLETLVLFIRKTEYPDSITINDQIGGRWGEELRLALPPEGKPEDGTVRFKFTGKHIEAWTNVESKSFTRFDAQRADEARLLRMVDSTNPNMILASRIPRLSSSLSKIEHRILTHRINALEEKVDG